jgi:hypothetical protein
MIDWGVSVRPQSIHDIVPLLISPGQELEKIHKFLRDKIKKRVQKTRQRDVNLESCIVDIYISEVKILSEGQFVSRIFHRDSIRGPVS